jgi:tRNA nucleotidyltransferase (CCA-adding enzyme)
MADYIYLLENRLSVAQRAALQAVREVTRLKGLTLFLVGGAVRDLTSGSPVRDLDVAVHGNALKLRKDLERAGASVAGELEAGQALFLRFPGGVRLELGSTLAVTFPKPGKPFAKPAGIQDDLRRRDFTANAMALSLNEGSYGLLIDPLNGAADIENRELRLVSNYGFIEDPVRMIRAARLMGRLGWTLEEKTQARYDTGKEEKYISILSNFHRGYELEEIFHEEDPLRVMRRLESEGWMTVLSPFWNSAKVNEAELERLRDTLTQLELQGVRTSGAAATFPLLTAKLSTDESNALKVQFPRAGYLAEIESLEAETRDFATMLSGKAGARPSDAWKLITSAKPEVVLWAAFSVKNPTVQARFKSFFTDWPQARSRMPYTMMAEMRITSTLPEYDDLLEKLFFELMDGNLGTPEEMKAYLEPYSPPAPPPQVAVRRPRANKKESKGAKGKGKAVKVVADQDEIEEKRPASDAGDDDAEDNDTEDTDVEDQDTEDPDLEKPDVEKLNSEDTVAAAPPPVNSGESARPVKAGQSVSTTKSSSKVKAENSKGKAEKLVEPAREAAATHLNASAVTVKSASKPAPESVSTGKPPTTNRPSITKVEAAPKANAKASSAKTSEATPARAASAKTTPAKSAPKKKSMATKVATAKTVAAKKAPKTVVTTRGATTAKPKVTAKSAPAAKKTSAPGKSSTGTQVRPAAVKSGKSRAPAGRLPATVAKSAVKKVPAKTAVKQATSVTRPAKKSTLIRSAVPGRRR